MPQLTRHGITRSLGAPRSEHLGSAGRVAAVNAPSLGAAAAVRRGGRATAAGRRCLHHRHRGRARRFGRGGCGVALRADRGAEQRAQLLVDRVARREQERRRRRRLAPFVPAVALAAMREVTREVVPPMQSTGGVRRGFSAEAHEKGGLVR